MIIFDEGKLGNFGIVSFQYPNLLHVSDFVTLAYNRFPVKRRKWISWRVEFLSYQKSYWEKFHYKSGGILREVRCDLDMVITEKISQAVTFWKESFWPPAVRVYHMTFYPASIYYCQVPAKTWDFPIHCNAICQILYTLKSNEEFAFCKTYVAV